MVVFPEIHPGATGRDCHYRVGGAATSITVYAGVGLDDRAKWGCKAIYRNKPRVLRLGRILTISLCLGANIYRLGL